jgi:hypothetical protein
MQLTTGKKKFIGSRPRFLCIFMLLNSACRVSGLLDWHGPPRGRFVHSIASVSSPRSTTRLAAQVRRRKLIIHGDDQIVPIDASARAAPNMVKDAVLKVYPSAPYDLAVTHRDELNAYLFDFIKG